MDHGFERFSSQLRASQRILAAATAEAESFSDQGWADDCHGVLAELRRLTGALEFSRARPRASVTHRT